MKQIAKEKMNNFRFPWKKFIGIVCASIAMIIIISFSFILGYRMSEKHTPLIDAAMEIKLEATTAHLWFEEIISGDRNEKIEDVLKHIANAMWYANAMIEGGENPEGTFLPLQEPDFIKKAQEVLEGLGIFKEMTLERFNNFKESGVGSDIDQRFDEVFQNFLEIADQLETELQKTIAKELYQFRVIHILLISFLILLAILIFVLFYKYEKERAINLEVIEDANEKLRLLSMTDGLTGIANKRHFNEYFEKELHRAIREKNPLSIILVDIDHFKKFNDCYGHIVGDDCLIKVANTLKNSFRRPADLVARFGGEEFSIILPNTDEACEYAITCKTAIEALKIPHEQSTTSDVVTVSIGMSSITPNTNSTAIELIQNADKALYRAKESGRNRVVKF